MNTQNIAAKKTTLEIITDLGFIVSYTTGMEPFIGYCIRFEKTYDARSAEAKLKAALPNKANVRREFDIVTIAK
jgi:hypothetical protein